MNLKSTLAALAALAIVAGPAQALTMTNNDAVDYEVIVIEGQGDGVTSQFDLEAGGSQFEFCENGCTIQLSNGTEATFNGDESVLIEDGQFVIAE